MAASVLSAVAGAACSRCERGSAAAVLNGPSQWVWGEREGRTRRATVRHTLVGYAIHHASSLFWATLYERAFATQRSPDGRTTAARITAEAALIGATAYFVDYHLTPRRLRPGFDKHVGSASLFAIYASFAAGLAGTTLARRWVEHSRH